MTTPRTRRVLTAVEVVCVTSGDAEQRFTVATSDRYLRAGGSLQDLYAKIELCGHVVFLGFGDRPFAVVIGEGFDADVIEALASNDVFLAPSLSADDVAWLESIGGRWQEG